MKTTYRDYWLIVAMMVLIAISHEMAFREVME